MVGLYRKVRGGAKLGSAILFRWLAASMAVPQEIAQAWHEERQREQSTLALFRRMRESMDAVLMGWLDMGSGVQPMGK